MDGKELKIVREKGKGYGKWLSLTNLIDGRNGNIYTTEEDTSHVQIINLRGNSFPDCRPIKTIPRGYQIQLGQV